MKLIARKPCSFGGKKYFIGDEIPSEDVIQPKKQESLGVLTIMDVSENFEKIEEKKEVNADPVENKPSKKTRKVSVDIGKKTET